jgi:phage gp46-like protein
MYTNAEVTTAMEDKAADHLSLRLQTVAAFEMNETSRGIDSYWGISGRDSPTGEELWRVTSSPIQ